MIVEATDLAAEESPPAPLLAVDRLTVEYRRGARAVTALHGLALSVAAGEVVGLVGPNGSGKTTFIRAVTGVVKPVAGEILLGGADAQTLSAQERARRVAVVPQSAHLPDAFTTLEVVLMGRTPHLRLLQNEGAADLEAAHQSMLATGTWEFAERPVGELSGGERQLVVLARALAQDTPLLLLDEPTAHLDIGHQGSALDLVRGLCNAGGKGALAVVHDLTLASQYCDRIVLIRDGEVVLQGSAAETLREDILREVYGARVSVFSHPLTGRPVVAPLPDQS
jgi:iron complex transport system ATP-binding protein